MTLVAALWLAAVVAAWWSRRRAQRDAAWLRSDVPTKLAYARLCAEIERERDAASQREDTQVREPED